MSLPPPLYKLVSISFSIPLCRPGTWLLPLLKDGDQLHVDGVKPTSSSKWRVTGVKLPSTSMVYPLLDDVVLNVFQETETHANGVDRVEENDVSEAFHYFNNLLILYYLIICSLFSCISTVKISCKFIDEGKL